MFDVRDLINEQFEVRAWREGGMGGCTSSRPGTGNLYDPQMIKEDLRLSPEACEPFERRRGLDQT